MIPEPFTGVQSVIKAAPGWNHQQMGPMFDIPAFVGRGLTITTWRPSPQELALLNAGGVILVTQVTTEPNAFQVEVMSTKQMNQGMPQA